MLILTLNTYYNWQIATVYYLIVGWSLAEGKISTILGTLPKTTRYPP